MTDILLHIGYHKTASTFLQDAIFASAELGFEQPIDRKSLRHDIAMENSLFFDAENVRSKFAPNIEACTRTPVLSEERLSGHPFSGGYDSREIALRLRAIFPQPKILIVVREQQEHIRSIYLEYARSGGPETVHQFLRGRLDSFIPRFGLQFCEFHRLVEVYYEVFDPTNVLVLPYELLRHSQLDFVNRILQFAGKREVKEIPDAAKRPRHVSRTVLRHHFLRMANRFNTRRALSTNPAPLNIPVFRKFFSALAQLEPYYPESLTDYASKRLQSEIQERVGDFYRQSNQRLAQLVDWDPKLFGYS